MNRSLWEVVIVIVRQEILVCFLRAINDVIVFFVPLVDIFRPGLARKDLCEFLSLFGIRLEEVSNKSQLIVGVEPGHCTKQVNSLCGCHTGNDLRDNGGPIGVAVPAVDFHSGNNGGRRP